MQTCYSFVRSIVFEWPFNEHDNWSITVPAVNTAQCPMNCKERFEKILEIVA